MQKTLDYDQYPNFPLEFIVSARPMAVSPHQYVRSLFPLVEFLRKKK